MYFLDLGKKYAIIIGIIKSTEPNTYADFEPKLKYANAAISGPIARAREPEDRYTPSAWPWMLSLAYIDTRALKLGVTKATANDIKINDNKK